jgi:putative membrane protein
MDKRFSLSAFGTAMLVALASALASAQTQPAQGQRDAIDSQRGADVRDTGAAVTLSAADQQFLTEAIRLGAAEVQSAQLALQRSDDERVRDYAEHMIDEHGPANQELIGMARDAGILPPSDTDPDRTQALDSLNKLSGKGFDRAFLAMQVEMHREALEIFERQAREGRHQGLRELASAKVPVLREHLQSAQAMQPGTAGTAPGIPAVPPSGQAGGPAVPASPTTGDAGVAGTGTPGTVGATGTLRDGHGSLNIER